MVLALPKSLKWKTSPTEGNSLKVFPILSNLRGMILNYQIGFDERTSAPYVIDGPETESVRGLCC